jgi:hypothetical protein
MKLGMERLDLLRAGWNFARNFGGWRRSGTKAEPVNGIVLGPVHTIHLPSGAPATDTYWWESTYIEPIQPVDLAVTLTDLRKTERWLMRAIRGSDFGDRLRDALVRYGRALDERNLNDAFVRLWGVLEDITGVGDGDSHERVVKRASAIWENPTYERVALHRLRKWRNRMVHEGEGTSDAELLIYDLKLYVEALLRFCVVHIKSFRDWNEYCAYLDLPPNVDNLQRRLVLTKLAHRVQTSIRQAAVYERPMDCGVADALDDTDHREWSRESTLVNFTSAI